jgi:Ca-activated chloride channel family protein
MSALRQAEIVCRGNQELMLLGVTAKGAIKGRLLDMNLQQRFRNASEDNTEITYTFPLPFGAVLTGVDVELNGKQLVGEVTARSAARARYEEALSEGNSSIMLERNPDLSYTLELGNLMAQEECSITLRYAQVLALEHGQIRLMLPTTIAPRYGNPITQGGLQQHQVPKTDITAEYPFDISFTLHGDLARANVVSPSHKTGYFPGGDELVVRLAQRGSLDRDFILILSDLQSQSVAIACPDACAPSQTALMASFSPRLGDNMANPVVAKILVDCSGSMAGDSIDAARSALHRIVAGLEPSDKFSLSRFGSTVEHRSRGMWSGTPQAKASAKRWIDAVQADLGGTDMEDALVSTIAIANQGKSDILLVTDGEIHGINEVIAVATQSGHRVFVVAIGASPAEVHLRRLAAETGAACDFVAPGEDVEPAVLRMFSRMRASRASKLRVEWPQSLRVQWEQKVPSYAFFDDSLTVSAFIETSNTQDLEPVRLWGCLADAGTEVLLAQAEVTGVDSTANILARMVAFGQYVQIASGNDKLLDSVASTAQELAVQYQLVTDDTNFILVQERTADEKALEMPEAHQVAQMLPAGWGGSGSVRFSKAAPNISYSMAASVSGVSVKFSNKAVSESSPDYVSMATPSVWRTNRSAAASRVDALSSGGMEDYEIPAFLRKQVDDVPQPASHGATDEPGITPAEFSDWLVAHTASRWPRSYGELRNLGLGLALCEWLEFEIGLGEDEGAVVSAFIAVVQSFGLTTGRGIGRAILAIKGIIQPEKSTPSDLQLGTLVRAALQGLQAAKWPESVLNFPQAQDA